MQIGLKDLDPKLASALLARINALRFSHNIPPKDVLARQAVRRRWKGGGWFAARRAAVGGGVGMALGVCLGGIIGHPGAIASLGFLGLYIGSMGTLLVLVRQGHSVAWHSVNAEELRVAASDMTLSEGERTYLEVVCALLEAGGNVSEETGRDILDAGNTLLEHYRQHDDRLERLRRAVSAQTLESLEGESARLKGQLADTHDQEARESLLHGIALCEERLSQARALDPALQRISAQREVLCQTLLSVQSSVARLQAAPGAVALPDADAIRRAVSDVTAQTRAVEAAVEEVLALRAQ